MDCYASPRSAPCGTRSLASTVGDRGGSPELQPFHVCRWRAPLHRETSMKDMLDDLALLLRVFDPGRADRGHDPARSQLEVQSKCSRSRLRPSPSPRHRYPQRCSAGFADGLVQQHGDHGGVHTAGERADHMPVATVSRTSLITRSTKEDMVQSGDDLAAILNRKLQEHGVAVHRSGGTSGEKLPRRSFLRATSAMAASLERIRCCR